MTGRGFTALGFGLVGVGLLVGVAIGRSHTPEQAAGPSSPPAQQPVGEPWATPAWRLGGRQLTDTTPGAAQPSAPGAQIPPPNLGKLPARPTQVGLPDAGVRLDGSPPLPEGGVMPFDAGIALPDASAPPEPEPQVAAPRDAGAPPPAPPENLVRRGRAFNDSNITSSSFDDEDVSEYSVVPDRVVVPDRQVTRSSFDEQDRRNDHPTGP